MLARLVAKPGTSRAPTPILAVVRVRIAVVVAAEARAAVLLGETLGIGRGFVAEACTGGGARSVVGRAAVGVG